VSDDAYAILGVARGATFEEIRTAFRAKAREVHPDARPGDPTAADQFRRLRDAYQQLRQQTKPKKGAEVPPSRVSKDVFDRVLNKKRSEARYGPTPFHSRPGEGSNVSGVVTLSFAAAIKGGDHMLKVEDGGGARRRKVTLPAGMEDGQLFRLEGRVVRAKVDPDPHLTRDGSNVVLALPLSVGELVLGTAVRVPTVDGLVEITVPRGSRPGQRLRLRGKGVGGEGDQLCVLELVLPDPATAPVADAVKALAAVDPGPIRAWDNED